MTLSFYNFSFIFHFQDSFMSFGKLIDPNDILIRSLESQGIQRLYTPPELLEIESAECFKQPNGYSHPDSVDEPKATATTSTSSSSTHINTNNHKRELKKLNHSILIAYLDLLEILVKAPNTQIQIEQTITNVAAAHAYSLDHDPSLATPQPPPPETITTTIIKTLREQKLEDIELLFINMHHLINELRPHQARDNIRCTLEMQKQQRLETAQKFKQHLHKIVDILKKCIASIESSGRSKASVFLDELTALMADANSLTRTLDKIDQAPSLNGVRSHFDRNNNSSSSRANDANDVDMETCDHDEFNKSSRVMGNFSAFNNNSNKSKLSNNLRTPESREALTDACDFKDLILCDIIDEFLIKENEF